MRIQCFLNLKGTISPPLVGMKSIKWVKISILFIKLNSVEQIKYQSVSHSEGKYCFMKLFFKFTYLLQDNIFLLMGHNM